MTPKNKNKNKSLFNVDNNIINAQIVVAHNSDNNDTLNKQNMLEQLILLVTALITALNENTAAHKGSANTEPTKEVVDEKPAGKAKADKPAGKAKSEKPEKLAAKIIEREDVRNLITNTRAQLAEQVSPEAVALHKTRTREIIVGLGGTSISDIPLDKIAEAYELIKGIDVSSNDSDDLDEDDDL